MSVRRRALFYPLLVCVVLVGLARSASAQTTITDERAWLTVTLQGPVGTDTKWRWFSDTILRSRDGLNDLEVLSLRGYLTYNVTTRTSLGGGYTHVWGYPVTGSTLVEHRPFGQYAWVARPSAGTLTLRTRVEFRMVEGNDRTVTRLRQQVRFSHPFRKGSRFALVGYDELFVHLNASAKNVQGVDQNRVFAGFSDTVNTAARFEIGYLNQYYPGHGASAKMNHVLSGLLVLSF